MKFKDFALAECAAHVAHWNSVSNNLTCHPELDATHVATCVNVGGICDDHLKSFSGTINVDNRLRNKCAMTDNCHAELVSVSQSIEPLSCLSGTLSPSGEGKEGSVGAMKESSFSNKVYSLFTTHHSLKRPGATHVALCNSVGSYYRHWCGAFTLAEVLITLGIIGIVAAMTLPSLVQNYKEKQTVVALKKIYSTMSQAFNSAKSEGIEPEDWATEKTADGYGADEFMSHIKPYLKYY